MNDQQKGKTAIVFGATGLIGGHVTGQLLDDPTYTKVLIFVRRSSGLVHEKLTEHIIDFAKLDDYAGLMKGDDVYSCFGTTLGQTPDREQYRMADVGNVIRTAEICHTNGATGFAVVSSIGANAKAGNFYLRMKGEMEEGVQKTGYEKLAIVRPSFLLGKRKKVRPHELIAQGFMLFFGLFMWGKAANFKAIHARVVARSMIQLLNGDHKGQIIFSSGELRKIGKA
jgi:uncharacterized protein YbjT (DUF2867 family)